MDRLISSNDQDLLTVLAYLEVLEAEKIEKVHLDCPELGEALAILKDHADTLRKGLRVLGVVKTTAEMLAKPADTSEYSQSYNRERVSSFIARSHGKCVTPSGRLDGHMTYVRMGPNGYSVCTFCGKGKV